MRGVADLPSGGEIAQRRSARLWGRSTAATDCSGRAFSRRRHSVVVVVVIVVQIPPGLTDRPATGSVRRPPGRLHGYTGATARAGGRATNNRNAMNEIFRSTALLLLLMPAPTSGRRQLDD